jgi:hypothetical protein
MRCKERHILVLFLSLTLCLLISTSSSAYETWQDLHGRYFSMTLPERPLIRPDLDSRLTKIRALAKEHPEERGPYETDLHCPQSESLINKIFSRIINKNNLQRFAKDGPGLRVRVECSRSMDLEGPEADYSNVVKLNASIVVALKSEDEIALTLAHEIAHIVLGHTDLEFEYIERLREPLRNFQNFFVVLNYQRVYMDRVIQLESDADFYGALFAWNAGFNPSAFGAHLENIRAFYSGSDGKVASFVKAKLFDEEHKSDRQRTYEADQMLTNYGVSQNYSLPPPSEEMIQARKEFLMLNK